jgi:hypothetical protein
MPTTQETRPEDSRVAWYVVLEDARRRGDTRRETEARRQLQRLGVAVAFLEGVAR